MKPAASIAMKLRCISFREACAFIEIHHRHHPAPQGMKFCVCVVDSEGGVRGVVVAGRPSAAGLQDGTTLEVTRSCVGPPTPNCNSMLYGAIARAAWALGWENLVTYTEDGESGSSLKAAGWVLEAELPPRKNWYESSVKLRHLRNPEGRGGVRRYRWRLRRPKNA